jgi:PAS domain S-box-containing protein
LAEIDRLQREVERRSSGSGGADIDSDGLSVAGDELFAVLDRLPGLVFIQGADNSVRWANRRVREEFGDYRGRACFEVKRGRSEPCVVCPAVRIFESGRPEHWDWTDRQGRSYRMRGLLLESAQGEPLVLTHGLEVTAQNRLEAALQEAEGRFRLVLDHAGLGIVVVQDAQVKMANDHACRMAGYPFDEITSGSIAKLIHPEDRDLVLQRHVDRIAGREMPDVYECRFVKKDKSLWWGAVRGTRFYWEGEPATLNFITDVTAAKRIAEHIETAVQEKEVVVREMHQHLKNNVRILSSILSVEDLLAESGWPRRVIKETLSRLAVVGLIHDVLRRSRSTTHVDLKAFARGFIAELGRLLGPAAAGINLDAPGRPVYVAFDRAVACGLIINELARNASVHSQGCFTGVSLSIGQNGHGWIKIGLTIDGRGLPAGTDLTDDRFPGLNLVRELVTDQLDGQVETVSGPPVQVTATFQP